MLYLLKKFLILPHESNNLVFARKKKEDGNYLQYDFKHVYRSVRGFSFVSSILFDLKYRQLLMWVHFWVIFLFLCWLLFFSFTLKTIDNDCNENSLKSLILATLKSFKPNQKKNSFVLITMAWLRILNRAVTQKRRKTNRNLVLFFCHLRFYVKKQIDQSYHNQFRTNEKKQDRA